MSFKRKLLTIPGALNFGAALMLAGVITLSPFAVNVDDPRVFELDGDAVTNLGAGGDDWANAAGTASGITKAVATSSPEAGQAPSPPGFPFVIVDPPGDTIFTTGGSKDTNDVSAWKYTAGSVPDKDEILDAYAAAYKVTTGSSGTQPHTWIFFGADRFANNGDSNIGFWFFQDAVKLGGPIDATSATPFIGSHKDGDVLIVSAFTQGGAIGSIIVYEWVGDGASGHLEQKQSVNAAECTPGAPSHPLVCAIINKGDKKAPWPYTPKSGASGTFPFASFFEGGFDLTGFFQLLGKPEPCFSSFLAETRSSQTENAQLKDFVLGNFQLCSVSVSKACVGTPQIIVGDPSVVRYTFNGNVTNDGAGNLFKLNVADTFPAGALNTNLVQPVTPAGGLASGASAAYSGSFDIPNTGVVTNNVAADAAACDTCDNTVTKNKNGNDAKAAAQFGDRATSCHAETNPRLTLEKSCVVNLVPGSGGIVLADDTTIKVCNTSADGTQVRNISLTNNVQLDPPAPGTDFPIDSSLTLNSGICKTYTPRYIPHGCVTSDGRCSFKDVVRISSIPTDEFGTPLPSSSIPLPASAECRVCPFGACSLIQP